MKVAIVFLIGLAAVLAAVDRYPTKYDNVDIDNILGNRRLLQNYIKCLLDTGKCNEEGQTLKDVIPDALITGCSKCNDIQRKSVEKVVRHLVKNNKNDWDALLKKYDPQGTYRRNYEKYLKQV